jgi:3-oxoacyl-[acyl-carrier protein] reductase
MDLKLTGKTVLITGGSKGIGLATAEHFAQAGCHVILVARSADDLAIAKSRIGKQAKLQVETFSADLADSKNVEALAVKYANVDVLVNNAGAIPGGNLLDVDEATWRKAWDLKVFGYINMCRTFYALMKKRGGGVIINVTGNAALTRDPEYICGVAGNAALTAFSQSLGSVSPRDGIRVISVNPGPVETERLTSLMKRKALSKTGNAEDWRELMKPLAFGRACAPHEIGAMIAFLSSDLCSYNSGAIVVVDGGASARS